MAGVSHASVREPKWFAIDDHSYADPGPNSDAQKPCRISPHAQVLLGKRRGVRIDLELHSSIQLVRETIAKGIAFQPWQIRVVDHPVAIVIQEACYRNPHPEKTGVGSARAFPCLPYDLAERVRERFGGTLCGDRVQNLRPFTSIEDADFRARSANIDAQHRAWFVTFRHYASVLMEVKL
jgi:hypothetical protein